MMSDSAERWLNFGERVGGPTVIILVLLFGLYKLSVPVIDSTIRYMAIQTDLLDKMHKDLEETRRVVERDAAERKAELLKSLQITVEEGFRRLERNNR